MLIVLVYASSSESIAGMVDRCPRLRELNLTGSIASLDPVLVRLSTHCPLLQSLILNDCDGYSENGLLSVVSGCRQLTKLSLSNNTNISDTVMSHLGNQAPQILYLSLDMRLVWRPRYVFA